MISENNSIRAQVSAHFQAALRGVERGAIGFATVSIILFFGSLSISIFESSLWTNLGCAIGLIGLIITPIIWIRSLGSQETELPSTTLSITDQELYLNAPIRNPEIFITELRTLIQGRKPLPPPHGAVDVQGESADSWDVRKYTDQEQQDVTAEIQNSVAVHDDRIMKKLNSIEKKLTKKSHSDNNNR